MPPLPDAKRAESTFLLFVNPSQIQYSFPMPQPTILIVEDEDLMRGIIAGLLAEGETTVQDIDCIDTSFPTFFKLLQQLKIPFSVK